MTSDGPGYWMYETSGVLRPAVEAYLNGWLMATEHIAAMRAYLRQWIWRGDWKGPGIDNLRLSVDMLTTREAIDEWLDLADSIGIDPL